MGYRYDDETGTLQIDGIENPIVYKSKAMKSAVKEAIMLSTQKIPILIVGETGTGKGLFAQAIHYLGNNNPESFAKVDCGTIETNLALSELFGHVKGAFTGATHNKEGYFSLVQDGTIFLDEIGNQEERFQRALLTVVETGEFRPVGKVNEKPKKIRARIIAATNSDLEKAMDEGRFRKDLYYRLERGYISIPPLRERQEDLPFLIDYFLGLHNSNFEKEVRLADKAYNELLSYDFPGNVRQLESLITRAVIITPDNKKYKTFSDKINFRSKSSVSQNKKLKGETLKSRLEPFEKEIIEKALEENHYIVTKTAKSLDVSYKTLLNRMKEYGIQGRS